MESESNVRLESGASRREEEHLKGSFNNRIGQGNIRKIEMINKGECKKPDSYFKRMYKQNQLKIYRSVDHRMRRLQKPLIGKTKINRKLKSSKRNLTEVTVPWYRPSSSVDGLASFSPESNLRLSWSSLPSSWTP